MEWAACWDLGVEVQVKIQVKTVHSHFNNVVSITPVQTKNKSLHTYVKEASHKEEKLWRVNLGRDWVELSRNYQLYELRETWGVKRALKRHYLVQNTSEQLREYNLNAFN